MARRDRESIEQPFQPTPADAQESQRDHEVTARPFQVGEPLPRRMSIQDMCRAFPIDGRVMDRSTFHRHQRAGRFDRFEILPRVGARAWSGTLVQRYLDCEAGASRFVLASTRNRA